jgi:hypothetical protein
VEATLISAIATAGGAAVGAAASYAAAARQARSALEQSRLQFERQWASETARVHQERLLMAYQELAEWLHQLEDIVRSVDDLLSSIGDDQAFDELRARCGVLGTSLAGPPQAAALAQCLWSEPIEQLAADLGARCKEYAKQCMDRVSGGEAVGADGSGVIFQLSHDIRSRIRNELLGI